MIMTFGMAAILNMGTNFLCGTISFISNSVTVVLQLALAIDYAIILCHRYSAMNIRHRTGEGGLHCGLKQGDSGDFIASSLTTDLRSGVHWPSCTSRSARDLASRPDQGDHDEPSVRVHPHARTS